MALLEYKCPNCSGPIHFDTAKQEMVCPYCDTVISVEALKAMDEEMAQGAEPEQVQWGFDGGEWLPDELRGMAVYSCNSCSGEIVGDETLGATSCPFCGNPIVMTSKFSGDLRPDMLVPFKLNKDAALAALQNHYLKKKLLPKVFKDRNHLDEVKGVYIPFWLYSADADAHLTYNAKYVRRWSDSKFNYTETSTYLVKRSGRIGFSQVPVDGSQAIDDTLMESIEPYNMTQSVGFQSAYLAGFFANKYDVSAEQCSGRANQRMRESTVAEFAKTVVGYAQVIPKSANINLNCGGVKYALLPAWLLGTSWEGRKFTFAMNGQTGKLVGDLPLDKAAYRSWFLKIFGIVAAACLIITQVVLTFL